MDVSNFQVELLALLEFLLHKRLLLFIMKVSTQSFLTISEMMLWKAIQSCSSIAYYTSGCLFLRGLKYTHEILKLGPRFDSIVDICYVKLVLLQIVWLIFLILILFFRYGFTVSPLLCP